MRIYDTPGPANTAETLRLALDCAQERGLDLVVASSSGQTALTLLDLAKETAFPHRIVVVRHVYGMHAPGENDMPQDVYDQLVAQGVPVVTAAHALSGGERGLSNQFGGVSPVEVMAATLRMLGQGTKVCVEIALMALDHGSISYGKPVVAVGGSAHGADTACVLTPGYTAHLLDTKVHEILCKPY
ncbi:MAG: pyruvate kinase alpha/beta domain-containing protein [Evtepia sp.]|uniref:pyruvate kinase alpha/beta domain-containing protein n=1 Tax=Evtepia sp. TaxID=2773933 RepID=UPI002A763BCD|nr:pyruvate kinase alpha/beta domain-containing protein [Evtepia sp.]MDY3014284.1 pyruvate kinase alpha/beta domain-containing protein [Evtepia sp.]